MLCLSGFELYSRWVPLENFVISHEKENKLKYISSNALLHILARASRPFSGLNDDL